MLALLAYYPDRSSPMSVHFGSRGVTGVALSSGMYAATGCILWDRMDGACGGSVGQLELRVAALLKAVWWDLHLAKGGGNLWSPPPCQISLPSVQRVALWGEKPQNRPLSKLNTGALLLRSAAGNDVIQLHRVHEKNASPQVYWCSI